MIDNPLHNDSPVPGGLDRFKQAILWFFAGSFVFFLFNYGIRPIYDPDFWWHLKTGEVMIQNGGLLQLDPFTFSDDGVLSNREALILKGYWLWEITAYGLYSLFGFNGIFLINLLSVGAMASVVFQEMRRQQVGSALAVFLLTLGFVLTSLTYQLERPQVVSFLFAAILLALLARVRDGGQFGWTLPLLMILWANLHGGFVVGDLILLCFAGGAALEYRQNLTRLRHILLWIGIGIGASLLNPNGALAFGELITFQNSALMKGVGEYQSTWVMFSNGKLSMVALWLLIALYGFGFWNARRHYWPDLIVGLFLAVFSFSYTRNIGFFSVAMLPAVGFYLQTGAQRRQWQIPSSIPFLVLCTCAGILLWLSSLLWQGRQGAWPLKSVYPEAAITFIESSNLQGRMFNSYENGGYLLWRLAPQIKVFIDGRGLDPRVYDDWIKISSASTTWVKGRREYEDLLAHYKIDYVIQPIYDNDGNLQPLMQSLLNKPEWAPIYLDTFVYILARLTPENAETISTYRIDKNEFKTQLLLIYSYLCQSSPQEVGFKVARAGLLLYLSMYDEANAQIEEIKALSPNDQSLPQLQRDLALLLGRRLRE